MQDMIEDAQESAVVKNDLNEPKQYFINDSKFQLLKQCQQEIFVNTEVSPAIRKIVNELITVENLQKVKSKFVEICK